MIAYLFVLFGALSLGNCESLPIFKWDSNSNIQVTFSSGVQDTILLKEHNSIPLQPSEKSRSSCTFLGALEHDKESSAAVIGCPGDEKYEIVLHSSHTKESRFEIRENKETRSISNPYQNSRDDILYNLKIGSYYKDSTESFPEELILSVSIHYDFRFNQFTLGNTDGPIETLRKVLTASQADYYLPSLPTKVTFNVTKMTYYEDKEWLATPENLQKVGENNDDVHLNAYFGHDPKGYVGTIGIAWMGVACYDEHDMRSSVCEIQETVLKSSYVFSHETGHNLGMKHDFDFPSSNCTGIMDYGNPPMTWSECSITDFTEYYNYIVDRNGKWCSF